jgi:hypothetical protein
MGFSLIKPNLDGFQSYPPKSESYPNRFWVETICRSFIERSLDLKKESLMTKEQIQSLAPWMAEGFLLFIWLFSKGNM